MTRRENIALGFMALVVVAGSALATTVRLVVPEPQPVPRQIDEAALLRAIALKESRNNPRAIGRFFGERSKYQFTRDTWALHTRRPFTEATTNPALADWVANRHLGYVRAVLRSRHIEDTVRHCAAAWNYGPNFAKVCAAAEYVEHVLNLYEVEVRR